MFSSSPLPGGTHSSLPPIHLIIHLGGRISTAWDIRPITQSREATSSSPPTLPLLARSNLLERTLCLTQDAMEHWIVLKIPLHFFSKPTSLHLGPDCLFGNFNFIVFPQIVMEAFMYPHCRRYQALTWSRPVLEGSLYFY